MGEVMCSARKARHCRNSLQGVLVRRVLGNPKLHATKLHVSGPVYYWGQVGREDSKRRSCEN
jgi:hypothetical protein